MNPVYFIVKSIEGDYATLQQIDSQNTIVVALALLPYDIRVGSKLKSEMMEYEIVE